MDYNTFEEDIKAVKEGERAFSVQNLLLLKIYDELKKLNKVKK